MALRKLQNRLQKGARTAAALTQANAAALKQANAAQPPMTQSGAAAALRNQMQPQVVPGTGLAGMKKGGVAKAKTKKYAKGDAVKSSASKRGDGIAQRGKTKGRYI